jgi:hypothetical protein
MARKRPHISHAGIEPYHESSFGPFKTTTLSEYIVSHSSPSLCGQRCLSTTLNGRSADQLDRDATWHHFRGAWPPRVPTLP